MQFDSFHPTIYIFYTSQIFIGFNIRCCVFISLYSRYIWFNYILLISYLYFLKWDIAIIPDTYVHFNSGIYNQIMLFQFHTNIFLCSRYIEAVNAIKMFIPYIQAIQKGNIKPTIEILPSNNFFRFTAALCQAYKSSTFYSKWLLCYFFFGLWLG